MAQKPSDYAYDYVIDQIKTSKWKSDEKIHSENALASELNISRMAVRQAYDQLEALGMIVKKRGSGTYISNPHIMDDSSNGMPPVLLMDDEDVLSLLEFRKYFEYGSVRMFIENCSDNDVEDLRKIQTALETADNNHDIGEADFQFHSKIAHGTGSTIVIRINELLRGIFEEQQLILSERIGKEIALDYHPQLLNAIEKRDTELASLLMLRHVEAATQAFMNTGKA